METIKEFMNYMEEIFPCIQVLLLLYALMCISFGEPLCFKDAFLACLIAAPLKSMYDFFRNKK